MHAVPPPRSEAELLHRAAALAGRTLRDLAAEAGMPLPSSARHGKGWAGALLERLLGADAPGRAEPDFSRIGIELKTLPLNARGRPAESTWVCVAPLHQRPGRWEDSLVRRKLRRVLWLPIEATPKLARGDRRVGTPIIWSPDPAQEALLRADWEELTGMIAAGELEQLGPRHGRVLQIRPKAANARALTRFADADGAPSMTLPRGFYLRAAFTASIITDT